MGLLTMKYNEDEMYAALESALRPGEAVTAAVYCSFQETGFLASNTVQAGYAALTDRNRLIGLRSTIFSTDAFAFDMNFLQKLKISKGLFGSRTILVESPEGTLKFAVSAKIAGGKFPNHAENFQKLIAALEEKQATL